jgi:hypothetical protein
LFKKQVGKNLLQCGVIGKNFQNAPEFRNGFDNQGAFNNLFRNADVTSQIRFHDVIIVLWQPFLQIATKGGLF